MRSFSGHGGVLFSFAAIGSDSLSEASVSRQRKLGQLGCLPDCDDWQTLFLYCSLCRRRKARNGSDPCQILAGQALLDDRGIAIVLLILKSV